ncbi:MAG: ion transporter [Pseudohongiellaceae bacterium]|nr:ion transporter [Pseudohongiellaceae bacterium]
MSTTSDQRQLSFKEKLRDVIFGYDTPAGKTFDLILILVITLSVLALVLDSVEVIHQQYRLQLFALEWLFTCAFTVEYGLRIYSSEKPRQYIFSFYGIIDLLSILPSYIALLFPPVNFLVVVRILRVLRVFRVLKLFRYIGEANFLWSAIYNGRRKIFIFMFTVINLIVVFGTMMFVIEGPENGFTNIPSSIYWAIVTITTVGYGDIVPQTALGQTIAAIAMISGYAIIAVPTGIIGAELMQEFRRGDTLKRIESHIVCPHCGLKGHDVAANFCQGCGGRLE